MRRSLRTRIFLACFAIGAGCSALFGALSLGVVEWLEFDQIDRILVDELDGFAAAHAATGDAQWPHSASILRWAAPLEHLRRLPAPLGTLAPGRHEIESAGVELRVVVLDRAGWRYVVGVDQTRMERSESRVVDIVVVLVTLCAIAAGLVGHWLSRRVVEPVTRLAERVQHDGGVRPEALSTGQADDEIGALARALDDRMRRIAEFAAREREFTGHVSHELRTPLAVTASAIEVVTETETLSAANRARLERAAAALGSMHEVVDALLALARSESGSAREQAVDPAAVARDVVGDLGALVAGRPVSLDVETSAPARIEALPGALRVALRNLVANACQHTEVGSVRVRVDGARVSVADTGVGIPAGELARVLEPGYRATTARGDSEGLGLAIVRRLCERHGWRLDLREHAGGGTVATLDLAPTPPPPDAGVAGR